MPGSRRTFLKRTAGLAATAASGRWCAAKEVNDEPHRALHRQIGITTSSLSGHIAPKATRGKFTLLELPRILRDELDMTVIDLNTSTVASYEPKYLERVRMAADAAGSVLTNLKMNQRGLDMNHADPNVRYNEQPSPYDQHVFSDNVVIAHK